MKLTKPKCEIETVRVTARSVSTGKSKSTTLYQTTPSEVIEAIERIAKRTNTQN